MTNIKNQNKKALSVLLAFTLLLSAVLPLAAPDSVYADGEEDVKPTINVDYLGTAASTTDHGPHDSVQPLPGFSSIGDGEQTVFWLGVRISDFTDVQFIKDGGLYNLEISIDYDSDYISPVDNLNLADSHTAYASIEEDAWRKIIEDANFGDYSDETGVNKTLVWNSNAYELSQESYWMATPYRESDRDGVVPQTGNWKSQFISIVKKEGMQLDTNRFYNGAADAKQEDSYLLRIPFLLKKVPDDGSKPYVLRLSLSPGTLVMTANSDETRKVSYQWEAETKTENELNLKNIFGFGGDVNIFKSDEDIDNMTDLEISYISGTKETKLELYTDENITKLGVYNQSRLVYYISVPEDVSDLIYAISGMKGTPKVEHVTYDDPPVRTALTGTKGDTSGIYSGTFTLSGITSASGAAIEGINPEGMPSDRRYKDMLLITVGEGEDAKTYTVHIRHEEPEKVKSIENVSLWYKKTVTGDDGSTSESTVSIPLYKEESRDNQISYTTETAVYYATVPEDVGEIGYDILSDFENLSVWTANYEDPSIMSILSGTTHDAQTNTYSGLMALTGTVGANGTASGLEGVPSDSKYLDCMLIRLPKTGEEGAAAYDTYVTVHIRRANDEEDPGYENPLEILEIYYNELKENTETGTQEPVETKAHLFDNEEVTGSAVRFDPAAKIYYVCVPEGTDEVKLVLKGAPVGTPTVMHSDYAADGSAGITISNTSGSAYAWDGLVPMNGTVSAKDTTIPDGAMDGIPTSAAVYESYKDVILITVSDADGTSSTYTVHIMKGEVPDVPDPPEPSGEAYIKLNYGNSPYGLIMRDDETWKTLDAYKDDPDGRTKWQEAIKTAFNSGNRFTAVNNVVGGIANQPYSPKAWVGDSLVGKDEEIANPDINFDRNEYAQFIYNRTAFHDAGYEACHTDGTKVTDAEITRTIDVDYMSGSSQYYTVMKNATSRTVTISAVTSDAEITDISALRNVRPGIYKMKYSFIDRVTKETITEERPIILIWTKGDANLDGNRNTSDPVATNNVIARRVDPYTGNPDAVQWLYKYRILDCNRDGNLNTTDPVMITNTIAKRIPANDFYNNL